MLGEQQLNQLLHTVVDQILQREVETITTDLSSIMTQHITLSLKALLISIISQNASESDVSRVCQLCGIPTIADTIVNVVKARGDEIRQALIEKTATIFPYALADVNWSARIVVASSKAMNINHPTVILELRLLANDPTINQHEFWVKLELNKDELDRLVTTLEKPSTIMQQIQ